MAQANIEKVSLELDGPEAWALRNALGTMSENGWKTAGISDEGIHILNRIYAALDSTLDPE